MSLVLDPATEQRIQQELARGPYREPNELINRALDLLDSEDDWLLRNRDAIHQRLNESFAQIERGEGLTGEQLRQFLAERKATRNA